MKIFQETDAEVEGNAEGWYVEGAGDESDQEPANKLFIHTNPCHNGQPEEVLLLCETLDLLQGTCLLLQMNFFFAEQLNFVR